MKTLNDRISLNFASGFIVPSTGLYTYRVIKNSTVIFTGQIFLTEGTDDFDIDITDILKNYTYDAYRFYGIGGLGSGQNQTVTDHVSTVSVSVYITSTPIVESEVVGFFYVNPVKASLYPISTWLDPTQETAMYPYQEGVKRNSGTIWDNGTMFISHYPFIKTTNYGLSLLLSTGSVNIFTLGYGGRLIGTTRGIPVSPNILRSWYLSMSSLLYDSVDNQDNTDKYGIISVAPNTKLCLIDMCPAPYYLKWQNRYGSWCSYGFYGKNTYKENFNTEESINWKGISKKISTSVNPGWSLSTGWVLESEVPHFENIFTSPYLALYSVETDTTYEVILRDNTFEEKTYKNNGKKLVSLSFNLDLANQQLILS